MIQKLFDQIRGFILKQRLSAGDLNQRCGRIGFNPAKYLGQGYIHAFVVGIQGIAISTTEIASRQADEYAGESGIKGFSLYAVKYFIDSE